MPRQHRSKVGAVFLGYAAEGVPSAACEVSRGNPREREFRPTTTNHPEINDSAPSIPADRPFAERTTDRETMQRRVFAV